MRYDGIYRIASCWRKPGAQGKLMCRYLFIRCDNEPAPWSSEGQRPALAPPALYVPSTSTHAQLLQAAPCAKDRLPASMKVQQH